MGHFLSTVQTYVCEKISNSYKQLPGCFFEEVLPEVAPNPKLCLYNEGLVSEIGSPQLNEQQVLELCAGNKSLGPNTTIALAYAGHQFGQYVPLLGDGRAHLLGELQTKSGQRLDLQLKGSGKTPYSRNGDGKCALGPALREYIISEFMHAVNIPTTRSLAVIETGEPVQRDRVLPGAILARVASSHVRVGTFEYAAHLNDINKLMQLADFAIERHYPLVKDRPNRYLSFLFEVTKAQAKLIAKWMNIGFVHGVMNTDNMSISGETIDYGPCAFIDDFDLAQVYSSIDFTGRYAFGQQPAIAYWNLCQLAYSLHPLFEDSNLEAIMPKLQDIFQETFSSCLKNGTANKLGLITEQAGDEALIQSLFQIMHEKGLDFTLTFQYLINKLSNNQNPYIESPDWVFLQSWYTNYNQRLKLDHASLCDAGLYMRQFNPQIIPRNYLVQEAIDSAVTGDFKQYQDLCQAFADPYELSDVNLYLMKRPSRQQKCFQSFCGT